MFLFVPVNTISAVGPQGPAGPQGITGPQGATGPQGQAGAQGLEGQQGLQGQQGNVGPQGSNTSSSTIIPTLSLNMFVPDWTLTDSSTRITRAGNLCSLQFIFIIQGPAPVNAQRFRVDFTLLKADFGTPVPLNSLDTVTSTGVAFVNQVDRALPVVLLIESEDATSVNYGVIFTYGNTPLPGNLSLFVNVALSWYSA